MTKRNELHEITVLVFVRRLNYKITAFRKIDFASVFRYKGEGGKEGRKPIFWAPWPSWTSSRFEAGSTREPNRRSLCPHAHLYAMNVC